MKNIKLYSLLIAMAVFFSACDDDEHKGDSPDLNEHVGAITTVSVNPDKNFFNLTAVDFAAEEIEFTVDIDGFGLTEISSVDVEIVYTDVLSVFNEFKGEFEDSVFAPVLITNITSFPATITVSAADVAAALSRTAADFEVGDGFSLTLPINTADGRRLTVALNSDLCNEPAQPSFGGCGVAWSVACPSAIPTGDWAALVPTAAQDPDGCNLFQTAAETVTLTDLGGGRYELSDFDFGYFGNCCGNLRAIFNDVCNTLTLTGATEFGISWIGTGTYDPTGGANGTGQIIFACHFDATFGGAAATDSIVLDKQ